MSTPDAKKAEFARLFDLFERLASRRARPLGSGNTEDASVDDLPTSQELDPVLKKLSTIVDTSKARTRPRRNTVASIIAGDNDMPGVVEEGAASSDEDDDIASLTEFPLANAKKYPFTFRLMVHKLYKKDDWAKTIKEMLEKSKNEFKTLAEREVAAASEEKVEEEGPAEMGGAIKFKVATSPGVGGGRRGSVMATGRQRSQSIAGAGHSKGLPPFSPVLKSPGVGTDTQPDIRALKKRCVGRRKSVSGLLNTENGTTVSGAEKTRGTWVYDAAISSAERPVATTFTTFPPAPPPSPISAGGFSKYQGLGMNMPSTMRGRGVTGMKRRVSNGAEVPLMMPLQLVTNTNAGGLAARRRVMLANKMDGDSEERKPMKRAFAS